MGTIQVRNLPDETVRVFKMRAASNGQSLQEYMREFLIERASQPTVEELMERIAREDFGVHGTSLADATSHVRSDRDSRDSALASRADRASAKQ